MVSKTVIGAIAAGIAIAAVVSVFAANMGATDQAVQEAPVPEPDRITVVASFFPYYEFTKNVAGDAAVVEQFIPAGVPAHDWEPQPSKIRNLQDADVFVYNGLGVDSYVDSIAELGEFDHILFAKASDDIALVEAEEEHTGEFLEELAEVIHSHEEGEIDQEAALTALSEIIGEHEDDGHGHGGGEGIEEIESILHEIEDGDIGADDGLSEIESMLGEEDHELDPHIWLDPILVKQQVNNIRDALASVDPENADMYSANAAAYNEEIDAVDESIRTGLSDCSKDTFVPFHNAFTYFALRYDLHVLSLSGLSPDVEASAAEIEEFVEFVEENDIKVIFSEDLIDPRLAEVIADEAGAQVMVLSTIEGLTEDEVASGITFLDKMENNVAALKIALECNT